MSGKKGNESYVQAALIYFIFSQLQGKCAYWGCISPRFVIVCVVRIFVTITIMAFVEIIGKRPGQAKAPFQIIAGEAYSFGRYLTCLL
jgi:hypothetical protein